MPNMDGFKMAQDNKKNEALSYIPMLFLTARAREQDKINAMNNPGAEPRGIAARTNVAALNKL